MTDDLSWLLSRRRFAAWCGAAGATLLGYPLAAQQAAAAAIVIEDPTLMLIRDAKVQKELQLIPRQAAAVQVATDAVDPAYFLLRDLSAADRATKAKPLIDRVRAQLQQVLDRKQQKRFAQIVAQAQGHRALLRDDVAREMMLTASQTKELRDIADETEDEKRELAEKARQVGADKVRKDLTELMQNEQKQFVSVLNVAQKQRISDVFGPTFERSANQLPHFKPPKLPLPGPWINSEPLSLERLKGKVVALHFYAFA